MKRLIIFTCILTFMTILMCSCNKESSDSKTEVALSDYLLFETESCEEYIQFLNELDISQKFEIISISNSTYATNSMIHSNIYTITYKVCDESKDSNVQYDYYVFETCDENDYFKFLNDLDEEYEIFDISIGSFVYSYAPINHSFIVTYRKPL